MKFLWMMIWGLLPILLAANPFSPSILYLTWVEDPSTSMVIQWHAKSSNTVSGVLFRKLGAQDWKVAGSTSISLKETNNAVYRVDLTQLMPATDYEFQVHTNPESGQLEHVDSADTYRFRTLPHTLGRPVRFVVGGDLYAHPRVFKRMSLQVVDQDPDFVVVGGDMAYAYGRRWLWGNGITRWRQFLKAWRKNMISQERRLIPLLPVVGNHDVKKDKNPTYELFQALFPRATSTSYDVIDCGNYLSLLMLDTGHVASIGGQQAQWLDDHLKQRVNRPYKLVAYHVGGYPSVYPHEGDIPRQVREIWSPQFERYGVQAAFEHHNHAYKRTHPLRQGRIDPTGVVYMGDGSWGVSARKVRNSQERYFAKALPANAVSVVTLEENQMQIQALSADGQWLDEVTIAR